MGGQCRLHLPTWKPDRLSFHIQKRVLRWAGILGAPSGSSSLVLRTSSYIPKEADYIWLEFTYEAQVFGRVSFHMVILKKCDPHTHTHTKLTLLICALFDMARETTQGVLRASL